MCKKGREKRVWAAAFCAGLPLFFGGRNWKNCWKPATGCQSFRALLVKKKRKGGREEGVSGLKEEGDGGIEAVEDYEEQKKAVSAE